MKRYSSYFLIFGILVCLLGCQRDDICPTSTNVTPLLIIRFYDNDTPGDPVAPQNLSIRELSENNDSIRWVSYVDSNGNKDSIFRKAVDSITIPLRTDSNLTRFEFILNTVIDSDGNISENSNRDTLTFSYDRQLEYLNRACAYRTRYVNLKMNRVIESPDSLNWVKDFQVEENIVEDENQAHVSIFL